jgi:hypothetical protein
VQKKHPNKGKIIIRFTVIRDIFIYIGVGTYDEKSSNIDTDKNAHRKHRKGNIASVIRDFREFWLNFPKKHRFFEDNVEKKEGTACHYEIARSNFGIDFHPFVAKFLKTHACN